MVACLVVAVAASSEAAILRDLRSYDPYEFEHAIAKVWEEMGWHTEVSQQSSDRGIDIVATRSDPVARKELIQAKRYGPETSVGGPEIQQYASLRQQVPDADSVVVVTTGHFTNSAEELATQMNVKLIDGSELVTLVREYAPTLLDDRHQSGQPESASSSSVDTSTPDTASQDRSLLATVGTYAIAGGIYAVKHPEEVLRAIVTLIILYALASIVWTLMFGSPLPFPTIV